MGDRASAEGIRFEGKGDGSGQLLGSVPVDGFTAVGWLTHFDVNDDGFGTRS